MALKQYHIDAFVRDGKLFTGNPAAVVVLPALTHAMDTDDLSAGYPSGSWMQALANENNLAETAFVVPRIDGTFSLRWFTPTVEVDLCGHATLAAAHALVHSGVVDKAVGEIVFWSKSGKLPVRTVGGDLELDFPSEPPVAVPEAERAELLPILAQAVGWLATLPSGTAHTEAVKAFNEHVQFVGRNRMDLLVHVTPHVFQSLVPDISAFNAVSARGVIVTAVGDTEARDFVSRFFAPQCGVPEDPVTGSAHCALAPYWHALLGRSSDPVPPSSDPPTLQYLRAHQASRRGGDLLVALCEGAHGSEAYIPTHSVGPEAARHPAPTAAVPGAARVRIRGRAMLVYSSSLEPAALPPGFPH